MNGSFEECNTVQRPRGKREKKGIPCLHSDFVRLTWRNVDSDGANLSARGNHKHSKASNEQAFHRNND